MATSEIEKLERRYAENPHGLTFAPLAEVHRKNGDIARALELLAAGLELHPNYIPASIVLGRCHQDLGDLPAAEAAFAHVLRLDDENVIALKSLADINERQDRLDDAERWLQRLVSVDRSNEEAREQLQRVEAAKNGRPPAVPESPALESVDLDSSPGEEGSAGLSHPVAEVPVAQSPIEAAPASEAPELPIERASEPAEQETDATAGPVTKSQDAEVRPIPGLISQEFQPPAESTRAPLEFLDIDVETSEEVVLEGTGGSEFRVPNAAEEFREREAPVKQGYAARDTQGQSVAAFFRDMLATRPPGDPSKARDSTPPDAAGSGRPLQDGLSLSSVLGPSAGSADPKSQPGSEEAVSFDDFFGSPAKSEGEKTGEAGRDDLDQFHSWLQNLKR